MKLRRQKPHISIFPRRLRCIGKHHKILAIVLPFHSVCVCVFYSTHLNCRSLFKVGWIEGKTTARNHRWEMGTVRHVHVRKRWSRGGDCSWELIRLESILRKSNLSSLCCVRAGVWVEKPHKDKKKPSRKTVCGVLFSSREFYGHILMYV